MNKGEIESIAKHTSIALQLISKGTVWIEISKKGVKLSGDKIGSDIIMQSHADAQKIVSVLDYFGWKYEKSGDKITGEGVIAYTLFEVLMDSINDLEMTKNIFSKISFSGL